jgi:hypothetical protein
LIDKFNAKAQGTTTTAWDSNWDQGWDPIIPITIGGHPHLLSYKTEDELKYRVDLDKILPKGEDTQTVWSQNIEGDVRPNEKDILYRD